MNEMNQKDHINLNFIVGELFALLNVLEHKLRILPFNLLNNVFIVI